MLNLSKYLLYQYMMYSWGFICYIRYWRGIVVERAEHTMTNAIYLSSDKKNILPKRRRKIYDRYRLTVLNCYNILPLSINRIFEIRWRECKWGHSQRGSVLVRGSCLHSFFPPLRSCWWGSRISPDNGLRAGFIQIGWYRGLISSLYFYGDVFINYKEYEVAVTCG